MHSQSTTDVDSPYSANQSTSTIGHGFASRATQPPPPRRTDDPAHSGYTLAVPLPTFSTPGSGRGVASSPSQRTTTIVMAPDDAIIGRPKSHSSNKPLPQEPHLATSTRNRRDASLIVQDRQRGGAERDEENGGDDSGTFTFADAELLMATGQATTPDVLGDREKLMHEHRLMAYHNTRLVLALQSLGAIGDSTIETLQHRASARGPRCADCDAAQVQLAAMDKTLARASVMQNSVKEQLKVVKTKLASVEDENRTLRTALQRMDEMMHMKEASIAVLRTQVSDLQLGADEAKALRRTNADLLHRVRLLQTSDPVIRIVNGSSEQRHSTQRALLTSHAETQTAMELSAMNGHRRDEDGAVAGLVGSPSPAAPTSRALTVAATAAERQRLERLALESAEEGARVHVLSTYFNFHHLLTMLRAEEEQSMHLRCEGEGLRDVVAQLRQTCRDLEIELRTEKVRSSMAVNGSASAAGLPPLPPLPAPTAHPTFSGSVPAAPSSGLSSSVVTPLNREEVEEALRAEVWEWALDRVRTTIDDAMQDIQLQVDKAYAEGFAAARLQQEQQPQQHSHNASRSMEGSSFAAANTSRPRGRGPRHPGTMDSVTSIDDEES